MEFSVEVPGEANPLTPDQVFLALQSASSSQQLSIQTGTKQLQTWETQRGYFGILQAVFLNQSLPYEIRYLAIIQLKNGIDKYWRKTATNAITADEKASIRPRLLEGGREGNFQLALQNALVISKVVRVDYPSEWPDVLTDLMNIVRTADSELVLHRGLLILLQVVKELSTARIQISRLRSATPELVFLLGEIYKQKSNFWIDCYLRKTREDEGGALGAMENSLTALKIIRRLIIAGYEYPNHEKHVQELWGNYQEQMGTFLPIISAEPPILEGAVLQNLEKHAIQLSKLHVQMATTHPASFALLPNSVDLVRAYWGLIAKYGEVYGSETHDFISKPFTPNDEGKAGEKRPFLERLGLKGMVLLRACLKMTFKPIQTFKYRSPEIKEEQNQAVEFLKSQLLHPQLVSEMAFLIVTKFFVFRQVDLEAWEEEGDEWEIREDAEGDTWEFEIRPCAEKLFMDLVINFHSILHEPLIKLFVSFTGHEQRSIVEKDAVYTAMGLAANAVFKDFDFNSFLTSTLVNDVQQTGPGYKVLRRRIAILIGQWVTVGISEANRPLVYEIFQHLFSSEDPTNDLVVLITATRQLKTVVDDFSFSSESFLPYAPVIIDHILALVQQVDNTEIKLVILNTIRTISIRLEHHIAPFTDRIVALLPGLWEVSGEEHLIKQAILTLFSTLITSMKDQSQRYNDMVLPLIKRAVEPGSEMQVYLMEEALDLWSNILAQSPAPAPPGLLDLAECVFPLLEIGSENLRTVFNILNSYVLLAPEALLGDAVRLRILSSMDSILRVSKRETVGLVTTVVEDMIRAAEVLGGSEGVALITKDLHESGYSKTIFEGLHDAWIANESFGPDRKYPKKDDVMRTDYFTIIARIALADPAVFINMLQAVASGHPDPAEIWRWLSTEWFRHFDSMASIDRQKLSCLALTRLLELPLSITPLILEKLQDYLAMWTQVIEEMMAGRDDGGDNLVWLSNEGNEYESAEDTRRRLSSGRDPVHTVHTLNFVQERLQGVVERVGGGEVFQNTYLVNVDKDVLEGFQQLGSRREVD